MYRVTSVLGHCFNLDFAEAYRDWDSCDPGELFDAPLQRVATSGMVLKTLRDEARRGDVLVLFLDCDREGESIAFEVVEICAPVMKVARRVLRAKFSAVTATDVARAMRTLVAPDERLADAVAARQELDLRVGVAFTRFVTRHFVDKYAGLDAKTLSYGPCQSPTLGFVVRRDDDIAAFRSEPFWVARGCFIDASGARHECQWARRRCFDEAVARGLARRAARLARGAARVRAFEATDRFVPPPLPLNTVELLKLASRALRFSPHQTMKVAESLYLDGLLSYPRTESTKFPASFDLEAVVRAQAHDVRWAAHVAGLLTEGIVRRPRRGVDAGDHPPITPTLSTRDAPHDDKNGSSSALSSSSSSAARLYDLVVRRFLAAVSPDAAYASQRALFDAGGEEFALEKSKLLDPGYLAVLTPPGRRRSSSISSSSKQQLEDRNVDLLDALIVGCTVNFTVDQCVERRATEAPDRLSEAECVGLMEAHGIGTDASIATHIENICKRGYATVDRAYRTLKPTALGVAVYRGFDRVDRSLVFPEVRAHIERACDLIAAGTAARASVVDHAVANLAEKYAYFVAHVTRMEELFEPIFDHRPEEDAAAHAPFSLCGRTRKYLHLLDRRRPARLFNAHTRDVVALPQGGAYKASGGAACPECNSEVIWYDVADAQMRSATKPAACYPLCATCYDATHQPDYDGRWGPTVVASPCLECPLPDAHPLVQKFIVPFLKKWAVQGIVILEPHHGPGAPPRLVSTRPPVHTARFNKGTVAHVQIASSRGHLDLRFQPGRSPLDDAAMTYVAPPEDDLVASLLGLPKPAHLAVVAPKPRQGARGTGRGGRGGGIKGSRRS